MQSNSLDNSNEQLIIARRGIFARICHYITSGTEKIGDIGDSLITSAQKDLYNLKDKLMTSWEIPPEEKDTVALYMTSVISRVLYTPVLLISTTVASLLKLALGSVCMIAGFRLFTLLGRLCNTFYEVIKQACEMGWVFLKQMAGNALDFVKNLANRFCDICSRIAASIARNVIWVCGKLKNALDCVYQQIEVAVRCVCRAINDLMVCVGNIISNVFHAIGNVFNAIGALAGGGINAVIMLATTAVMWLGALFFKTGISKIVAGIANFLFTLNEGLASTIGAVLDGIQDCGQNLLLGARALFGYRPLVQGMRQPLLSDGNAEYVDIEQNLGGFDSADSANENHLHPGIFFIGPYEGSNKSCRKSLHGVAHDFNVSMANLGVSIEQSYLENDQKLFNQHNAATENPTESNSAIDSIPRLRL